MKKLNFLDRLINNKLYLFLCSLGLAFLFWFFVVAAISPDSTRTIYGISVTVNDNNGLLSTAGLHMIEESATRVSVDVTGPRYIIGNLKASDFVITPDVAKVTKSAKYNLKLDASMKNPNAKVSIGKISPASADFKFDTIASKNVPVEVKISNSKIADGYIMETASVNPKQVVITGPSDEVGQVARAVATVQVDSSAKSTVTSKSTVALYDAKNNVLDLKHINTNNLAVSVTVPILKLKTQVPFAVDFTNLPAGFDKSNIKYTINPSELSVAGEDKIVNAVTSIKLDSINFSTLDITNTLTENVNMPSGVLSVDNVTSASVTVNLLNTATKILNTKDIKLINIPSGYSARVRTTQLNNIKLFGPSSDIANLNAVTATVDMSTVNVVEGTYEVPVTISVPGKTGYWVTGKYNVTINSWKD